MPQDPSELLAAYFTMSAAENSTEPRSYSDTQIEEIATLLGDHEPSWSQVPHTYIVLRTINRLDLMESLLQDGFTDYCFPTETTALPTNLKPSDRAAIVKAQSAVLTKSMDLEKGEAGKHRHFAKGEPQPFRVVGVLGSGGYSQVHRIKSTISFKEYALKRVRRRRAFGNNKHEALNQFIGEIKLLKTLRHRHMTRYLGSFTDPVYLGLIMTPVAEMNLEGYLEKVSALPDHARRGEIATLRSFFGCLAAALRFLHDQSIRHRNIKPQNILVDGSNILFADFGLSKQYSAEFGSTTSGPTSVTARYAAPEVLAGCSRNSSSDVWSLGCVFAEMVIIVKGEAPSFLKDCLSKRGSMEPSISRNLTAAGDILEELESIGSPNDNLLLNPARKMLMEDRNARPTAAETFSILTRLDDSGSALTFCGICCLDDEVTDSGDSLCENQITTNVVIQSPCRGPEHPPRGSFGENKERPEFAPEPEIGLFSRERISIPKRSPKVEHQPRVDDVSESDLEKIPPGDISIANGENQPQDGPERKHPFESRKDKVGPVREWVWHEPAGDYFMHHWDRGNRITVWAKDFRRKSSI